ncbi:MAG: hypothetical protein VX617_06745, partial [Pseudomonadota bacterium]|nr:hypothetical protein [Pseudomonadota bacterium]
MPLEAFDSSASLLGAINGGVTRVGRALLVNAGNAQARAVTNLDIGFSERISKALSKLDEASTSPEIERLRRNQDQLIIKKERINNAAGLLNKTISQIQFLKSHIKHLEDEVAKFENSEITSVELANDWDNKIRKINQIVMNADFTFSDSGVSYTKNLLNSSSRTTFRTQRFYAPITPNGAALEIKGAYLGTDWFITDKVTGTLFWNSDTGFLSSEEATGTLTEYTSAVTFPGSPTGRTEDIGSQ